MASRFLAGAARWTVVAQQEVGSRGWFPAGCELSLRSGPRRGWGSDADVECAEPPLPWGQAQQEVLLGAVPAAGAPALDYLGSSCHVCSVS